MTKFTRKILLTVTSCLVCLGIAVGTLLAVLAQSNILVTTDVSVSYVSEINATVASHYWLQGQQGGKTQLLATTEIAEGTKTNAEPVDVRLSQTQRYVVFEYAFTNSMVNLDAWAHLAYTDTDGDDKNMALAWAWSASSVEIGDAFEALDLNEPNSMTIPVNNIELKAGSTKYVYIKVYIDDLREDAVFTGSFKWTFSFDEEATSIEHFTPVLNADGETATLTNYTDAAGDNVVVPSYYYVDDAAAVSDVSNASYSAEHVASKKITITGIGAECFIGTTVKTIILPDTIETIGEMAFAYGSLEKVQIPNSVISIGNQAFEGCRLKEVQIPNSVTSIGNQAFASCLKLERVKLPTTLETLGNSVFEGCSKLEEAPIPAGITSIGERAYYGSKITSIVIPEGVTSIGNNAFNNCTSLTTVTLPNTLERIDYKAFYNCSALTKIEIPEGITIIETETFAGCSNLMSVTLPSTLIEISTDGDGAFYYCYKLYSVINKSSLDIKIGERYNNGGVGYYAKEIISDASQSKLEFVGDFVIFNSTCFVGYTGNATSVVIPNGITEIDKRAFKNNTTMKTITLPAGLTTVGNAAFSECSALESVVFPDGFTTIGEQAFELCTSLRTVQVPESLTTVGEYVFFDCISVTLIVVGNVSAEVVGQLTTFGVTTIKVVGTRTNCDFVFGNGSNSNLEGSSVTTLDLSETDGLTHLSMDIKCYSSGISTNHGVIILPDTITDISGLVLHDYYTYGYTQYYFTIIARNEYVYNSIATGGDAAILLQTNATYKILKSVVDNATTQNAELENSANYTRTTETIDGEEFYVYTKVAA